jgi:hypothetical protein
VAAVVGDRVLNVGPSPARHEDHTPWYEVGDQGKTGSCVGWALADSVMWRQLVRKARLAEEDRLSPRFMWMAAKEMRARLTDTEWHPTTFLEQGMTDVTSALDVARTVGAAPEEDLRWQDGLYPGDIDHFYRSAAQRRIQHYYRLDPRRTRPRGSRTGGAGSTSTARC